MIPPAGTQFFTPGTPEADAEGRRLGFRGHAATLWNGQVVCSWSREWREECESRHLEAVRMLDVFADAEVRRAHLAKVEAAHGPHAREKLEAAVMGLWQARRARRLAEMAAAEAEAMQESAE